jgi:hypothetical protein
MPDTLETRLQDLAVRIDWPQTPELRPPLRRAIVVRRPWFQSRWAPAAVAVIAIVSLPLAYTPTRTAIAGWINLHTRITHTTSVPTPSPLPPGPIGQRLGLGTPTTLSEARKAVTWPVLVPASLGEPDEVYLETVDPPSGGEVTLVYGPKTGLPVAGETGASVLITEARGTVSEEFFGKMVGDSATVTPVSVGGHQGWWISGTPHVFFFIGSDGTFRNETLRLATNTLILDMDGTIVRIEGNLTLQQAEQIASSLN